VVRGAKIKCFKVHVTWCKTLCFAPGVLPPVQSPFPRRVHVWKHVSSPWARSSVAVLKTCGEGVIMTGAEAVAESHIVQDSGTILHET
jgi:hypothetical protein